MRAIPCTSHRFRAIIKDLDIQGRTENRVYNPEKQKGKIVNRLYGLKHGYVVRIDGTRSIPKYLTHRCAFGKCGNGVIYDAYFSYFTRTYNPYGFFGDGVSFAITITMDNNIPYVPGCTCVPADKYCDECGPVRNGYSLNTCACASHNGVASLPCNACITYYSYDRIGYVTSISISHTTGRPCLKWIKHKYTITFDENQKPRYSYWLYDLHMRCGGEIRQDIRGVAKGSIARVPSLPNRIKRLAWPTIKRYMPANVPEKN